MTQTEKCDGVEVRDPDKQVALSWPSRQEEHKYEIALHPTTIISAFENLFTG